MAFRSGIVALMGKPNVGKSTLTNALVGQKVSIVGSRPQTTRRRALGIVHGPNFQFGLVDTPGIHEPHTQLGKAMVDQAKSAVQDVDVIVVVVDSSSRPDALDQSLAELLGSQSLKATAVILCLNKMDRLKPEHVQAHVELYCRLFHTDKYMLTRATTGDNLSKLCDLIVGELPEQPPLFGDEDFTDQSARFLVSELIREKVLLKSRQEIPYATAVLIEQWEEEPNLLRIGASLLVERASQKGILIGKHGAFIKAVGQEARAEIEALLGRHVYLDLHVGVRDNWRMSPRVLRELEYME